MDTFPHLYSSLRVLWGWVLGLLVLSSLSLPEWLHQAYSFNDHLKIDQVQIYISSLYLFSGLQDPFIQLPPHTFPTYYLLLTVTWFLPHWFTNDFNTAISNEHFILLIFLNFSTTWGTDNSLPWNFPFPYFCFLTQVRTTLFQLSSIALPLYLSLGTLVSKT